MIIKSLLHPTYIKRFIQSHLRFGANWAGDLIRRYPALKSLVFKLIAKSPALHQKLRKVYLQSKFGHQNQVAEWAGIVELSKPPRRAFNDRHRTLAQGINTNQSGPLESNFHLYNHLS